jgi:glyoxylase-like metal-dependent hydrolase (beta-lactamase superfamily II)
LRITRIAGGPLPTNCYLLEDEATGEGAVVDPGFESGELSDLVRKNGNVKSILLTHGHFDHISGVRALQEQTGAKVYLPVDELLFVRDGSLNLAGPFFGETVPPFRVDVPLSDGDEIPVGKLRVRVMRTPGHTCGGCCFLVEDAVFSGDTLMKLSCGRTDCPTGSAGQMMDSLRRLAALPGDRKIYPGHGSPTTLDYERRNNVYLETR